MRKCVFGFKAKKNTFESFSAEKSFTFVVGKVSKHTYDLYSNRPKERAAKGKGT